MYVVVYVLVQEQVEAAGSRATGERKSGLVFSLGGCFWRPLDVVSRRDTHRVIKWLKQSIEGMINTENVACFDILRGHSLRCYWLQNVKDSKVNTRSLRGWLEADEFSFLPLYFLGNHNQ